MGGVLRLLRSRRWISFTAVVLAAIVAFGLLSRWQWARAEQHRAERIALSAAVSTAAAPLDAADPPPEWTLVTVEGTYLPELQAAVRKRPLDAMNGFWMMTAMQADGQGTVWVNRGWMPVDGDALATPPFPTPPTGPVTVSGYVRSYEDADAAANTGLPEGQIAAPAEALLPPATGTAPVYVQLSSSDPEQTGLIALPLPEIEVDEGRNISYAIQWILFALVSIGGWFFFLRREAIEDAARAETVDMTEGR